MPKRASALISNASMAAASAGETSWPSVGKFERGEIRRYSKKRPTAEMRYIDYGIAVLSASVFDSFADDAILDLADVYSRLVSEKRVAAHEVKQRFYEIGSRAGLAELDSLLRNQPASIPG